MKKIKVCSIALSTCLAMGIFAGCSGTTGTTATAATAAGATDTTVSEVTEVSIVDTTASESVVSVEPSDEYVEQKPSDVNGSGSGDVEYIELDAEGQKYANLFISDFAEQFITYIDRQDISYEQLMDFVHIFLKINSQDSITYEKKGDLTFETFTLERAHEVAKKHFGIFISEAGAETLPIPPSTYGDQPAGPYYEDGKIWYEAADGESHNLIAIVDYATNNFDGTITLRFTIYAINMDTYSQINSDELKAYYSMTAAEAKADSTLAPVVSGTAVVDIGQSGEYYLISYKTDA